MKINIGGNRQKSDCRVTRATTFSRFFPTNLVILENFFLIRFLSLVEAGRDVVVIRKIQENVLR